MTTTEHSDVVEGEIVDGITEQKPPVPPRPQPPGGKSGAPRSDRKPLIPPWMRNLRDLTRKVDDTLWGPAHTALYHLMPWHNLPHVLTVLKYAPRGAWRDLVWVVAWMRHWETKEMRLEYAARNQGPDWDKVEKRVEDRLKLRWRLVLAEAVLALTTLWLQWWLTSDWHPQVPWMVWWWPSSPLQLPWLLTLPWPSWLLLAGAIVWWGYRGRPVGKRLIQDSAVVSKGVENLTGDIVLRALCSLGISKMTKPEDIELLYGVKPTRAGYHIDLTLPYGVTATEVMAKRDKLSSGLQRGVGTVWPSVGPRHAGHLQLFISHEDMSMAKQKPWPLLKRGSVNLFQPVPMFTDQQGDWVDMPPMATTSGLIGAVPRMGKTYFQRELSLVCGLDVRCEQYIFELKGTGDLSCAKLYAHYYSDSDEEEDIAEHLEVMRRLVEERRRRAKVLRSLPNDECPRSEVTDELASRRDLGLHPILIEVDECQVWFMHMNKLIRDEFERLADDIVRKGPAVGMMAYFSTQELGKDSIPASVRRNASIRLCFKVNDPDANNKVLGPGSYGNGYQATMFDFYKDKGIAYLRAEGPPQIVRTVAAMDKVEADKVALRIHNMRKQAGRLTGMAAGEAMEIEAQEVQLLDAIRALFGSASAMHLGDIASGLAGRHSGMYGSLDADGLGKLLRGMTPPIVPTSVYVRDKSDSERTGKGLKREQLDVATTSETAADDPRNNVRQLPLDR